MKAYALLAALFLFSFSLFAQTFQTAEKVDVFTTDGKVYTATVIAVEGDKYRIRYDGYGESSDAWTTASQLQKQPAVGSSVEMYGTDGKWYKATVMEIANGQYKLRFTGYAATSDLWLKREQFRTVAAAGNNSPQPVKQEVGAGGGFTVGSKVDILWGGTWFKGSVVEIKDGKYKVHYDGWDSSWDEWVKEERIRVQGTTTNKTEQGTTGRKDETQQPQTIIAQNYSSTTGKVYLRTLGRVIGSSYSLDINWVFLGADGTIVYDPVSGADPIDYKAEVQHNGSKIGKYTVAGNKMLITWRNGKKEEWKIEKKGNELSALNSGIVSRPDRMPAYYRIAGQYASAAVTPNLGSVSTFVFSKDGTFTLNNFGMVTTNDGSAQKESDTKGTYTISGNTLTLQFANGEIKKSLVCIWDMGEGKKSLVINRRYFPQER